MGTCDGRAVSYLRQAKGSPGGVVVAADQNRGEFEAIVRRPDGEIDLGLAALLIAREEYPLMETGPYLRRMEEMAAEARDLVGAERHPRSIATGVSRYLFAEMGFAGASEEYFNPCASYLNDVLDRRIGIPLSLSLVYMEVARRAGFTVEGVGLPGHFIVKLPCPGGDVFVDPFDRGSILTPDDCACKVRDIYGGAVPFQPFMLGAVTKRQVLTRMIHNLKTIYLAAKWYERALSMVELLLVIAPWDLDEIRDRGMLRYRLGDFEGAAADLETYLKYCAAAQDVDLVRRNVRALKRMLGESAQAS
jgi:regulator of sirC expression with transglutaminase-like and TPR domain